MNETTKASWVLKVLKWICPADLYEAIEGDLLQKYHTDVSSQGIKKARRNLCWNAIRFIRPGIILRHNPKGNPSFVMIPNYLIVAIRNGRRHLLFSLINIISLSIGFAACLIIYLFVAKENSFDNFHTYSNQIFRITEKQQLSNGVFQNVALTGPPFGPSMVEDFPEVKTYVRIEPWGKLTFRRDQKQILLDEETLCVDSTFLQVFDFIVLQGDRRTMLDEPSSLVLTKSTALKFFKSENEATGKTIGMGDDDKTYTITGVVDDPPDNSHIQFGALASYVSETRLHPEYRTDWTGNWLYTYILLHPNSNISSVESKLLPWLIRWTGDKEVNKHFGMFFQPLKEIHLSSSDIEHDYVNHAKFNGTYLKVFGAVGGFILFIASLNFVNLSNARSSYRWREVGVRKSIGAKRRQLVFQFMLESVMLSFGALVMALLCDSFIIPLLKDLTGVDIKLTTLFQNQKLLCMILALSIIIGVLSALFPSLYMSSVNVVLSLKGTIRKKGKPVVQSTLVTIQFGLALALIVGTLVVLKQLSFIQNENLGFNKDQILLVSLNKESRQKLSALKTELNKITSVKGVTASSQRLGNNPHQTVFFAKSEKGLQSGFNSRLNVDKDFIDVYQIELMLGRNFSDINDIGRGFLINESMAKELQLTEPIGVNAGYSEESIPEGRIVGVVKDFKYNSLHHKVLPISISYSEDWQFSEISIRLAPEQIHETISDVKAVWEKLISTYPFEYSFLDEHIKEIYEHDRQLGVVVTIMSALSLFIAAIGLFGLTAIITERRTKEVAVRRIHGASPLQIVNLLSRNLMLLVVIAFVLMIPVTYLVLNFWLSSFAYRINIGSAYFFVAFVIVIVTVLLTINIHFVRILRTNAAQALRNE